MKPLLFACACLALVSTAPVENGPGAASMDVSAEKELPLAWVRKTLAQEANTWLKRSPGKDVPRSPGMGYETSLGYDPVARKLIRWGGHNQGGGGEQNAETWILDIATMKWELKEPNRSPPGVCCAQQNVFDVAGGRFLRFPAFSGSHGWHWFRENYLNNTSVWSYDVPSNTWRDMRPAPAIHPAPLRCASWDSLHQVVVIFGGEGSKDGTVVYDPYTNTWTKMSPKKGPEGRSGGNMTYDAARKLHILFGSQFTDDPHTWAYDLAKNEWRDMKPDVQPPANRNDAVLAYDPASKKVIAVVRAADVINGMDVSKGHLETWAYDAGKNEWQQMKPKREPDGWGNRRRVITAIPDQQMVLMEIYVNPTERVPEVEREQQVWTYRFGALAPEPKLSPPTGLSLVTKPGKVTLTWQPATGQKPKAYKISRGEGEQPWPVEMKEIGVVPAKSNSFTDDAPSTGKVLYYTVRAVDDAGNESEDSPRVRAQPRIVEDAVVSVRSAKEVQLGWKPPSGPEKVTYHVERAVVEVFSEDEVIRLKKDTAPLDEPSVGTIRAIGPFEKITKKPITATTFTDKTIDLTKPQTISGEPIWKHRFRADQLDEKGKPYRFAVFAYRIRAVNTLGVESGPSPYFLTIPSAPQFVFGKEEDKSCHLKWAANPEQGLKGHRVYRMEGPRINGPGQKVTRLTAAPMAETTFTDAAAGKDTRRFWVVAVDALGQEGFPSAPVWHYRQYRTYYEPFAGEWHQ